MLILGLMSGTSADGIDVALVEASGAPPRLKSELIAHTIMPMPPKLRTEVLRVAEGGACTAATISQLNFRVGKEFAKAAVSACRKFGVSPQKINLIGSHGQTIFHEGAGTPFFGEKTRSTLQIGEGAVIAAETGIPTVSDFRVADVAAGGQGAPLVPYIDWLLLRDEKLGRIALNLGGIGNVTVLPAGGSAESVYAFDTGPGNMIIDALVARFTRGKQRFDRDGQIAAHGNVVPSLLTTLLKDSYLKLAPPKSTGREYYGREFVDRLERSGMEAGARPEDLVRTATSFTALSVADALARFVFPKTKIAQVVVSGGGARNPMIMNELKDALRPLDVIPIARLGLKESAKEAYAFALLAYESWKGRPGNLPGATGARRRVVLGKVDGR